MQVITLLYVVCIAVLLLQIWMVRRWKIGLLGLLLGIFSGGVGLVVVHYVLPSFGTTLAINFFTALCSVAFGLPGVTGMAIFQLLLSKG